MTLIGYWPLNEESGDKAYDHSGNENHGSLSGGVTQVATGILNGKAYDFNGIDGYMSVPDSKEIYISDEATVSAWVKIRSKPDNHPRILQKEPTNDAYILWNSDDSGHIDEYAWRIDVGDTDHYDVYTNGITYTGDWEFIVGTYNGSEIKIYYNGKMAGTTSVSGQINNTSGAISIGGDKTDGGSELDGKIAEIRMYNRALTPSEIQYLYNVSKQGRFMSRKKSP